MDKILFDNNLSVSFLNINLFNYKFIKIIFILFIKKIDKEIKTTNSIQEKYTVFEMNALVVILTKQYTVYNCLLYIAFITLVKS